MGNTAIVLAGGNGSRMKSNVPKQFLLIHDRPIVYYSLRAFEACDAVEEVVLVSRLEDLQYCKELVSQYEFTKVKAIVSGGAQRADSVYAGLRAMTMGEGFALIHDGARPCINDELVDRLLAEAAEYGNAVAAVPTKDTVKIVDTEQFVVQTPNRAMVWNVQTPQVFEKKTVFDCYRAWSEDAQAPMVTDDAMVVEYYPKTKVRLTMGDYENLKITTPEDLIFAEKIL